MKIPTISGQTDILESILHGIMITDLRGHITYWNGACEQMLGYSSLEMMGKPVRMIYDDKNVSFKKILSRCLEKKLVKGRWHAKCKDHSRIWLDVRAKIVENKRGKPELCVISVKDIEKLEATKRDLARNKQLAETILETSAEAIITTDEYGFILSFNRTAEEMFGYARNEMILKKASILIPETYRPALNLIRMSSDDQEASNIHGTERELFGLKKDGTVFPVSISLSVVSWYGNRIYVGVIRDLSQRRELEKRIAEISNEERRNIGRELHDGLGQMLTGIRMLSENLAKKCKTADVPCAGEIMEIADMIRESDEYARSISRGLVEADLEKFGLSVAIQNLLARVEKTTGIQCTFHEAGKTEIHDHSKTLHIYRIIQEAVNNAVRHANASQIAVRLSADDKNLRVDVVDNGKGLHSEKDLENGSGIQIMKYRAELLGGILDLSRRPNKTTRVRCLIPHGPDHFYQ